VGGLSCSDEVVHVGEVEETEGDDCSGIVGSLRVYKAV